MRQDIKNRISKVNREEHAKIWNRTVREQLVANGYLDPALKDLSAFSQLIIEAGVNPNKPFTALISASAGRGYGQREFVLVSLLGGKDMYCMSESEFNDVIDPGKDGVRTA